MTQSSDAELLISYADRRSETAFAELVHRHIDLVHSTALRIAGAGLYKARQAHQLLEQVRTLQEERELTLRQQDSPSRRQSQAGETGLPSRSQAMQHGRPPKDPSKSAMTAWLDRVDLLKMRLELTDGAKIPEMQWLTEQDWLKAAQGKLESDKDYRRALGVLRSIAEDKFTLMASPALQKYIKENGGTFPRNLDQLQAHFDAPVDPAVLQRWRIIPASDRPNMKLGGDWLITQKAVVDEEFDNFIGFGPNGYGSWHFRGKDRDQ